MLFFMLQGVASDDGEFSISLATVWFIMSQF